MFTERTQVLLSRDQVERLKKTALRERKSVGAVIRDAVDAYAAPDADARRTALEHLLTLEAPVADWEVMKEEILRGAIGER